MMANTPSGSNPSPSPLISPFTPSAQSLQTPPGHLSTLISYVNLIGEPLSLGNLEKRLKAAQEIAEHLQTTIASHPKLNDFINDMLTVFMRVLRDTEPHFISEHPLHQLRKQILEIILRLPTNDVIKEHYVSTLLTQMFRLFEIENEENALICMKIIMDLHRYYRPSINAGIHNFLVAVKQLYSHLQSYMSKIFEQQSPLIVKDLRKMSNIDQMCQRINVEQLLQNTFTQMTITDTRPEDKSQPALNYVLLPRSTMSLKVLAEVPLMVVLWYQLYGKLFHLEIADFTVTTINCLLLQPPVPSSSKSSSNVSPASSGTGTDTVFVKEIFKEIYVDFITVQIKVASFIAFVAAKVYKDLVVIIDTQGQSLATGLLQLLISCPPEAYHLRRELLIAVRHILNSELMTKFIPHVDKLFDEKLLLSNGFSVQDSLQPLAYTTLADLVHRIRNHLSFDTLSVAVNFYARHVHTDSFQWGIQQICCRLMMNLVECIRKRTEEDPQHNGRDLLLRILEMYCLKFRTLAKYHIPMLLAKCSAPAASHSESMNSQARSSPLEDVFTPAMFVSTVTEFSKQDPSGLSTSGEMPSPGSHHLRIRQQSGSVNGSSASAQGSATSTGGIPAAHQVNSSSSTAACPLVECRHLVKTLVGATKQVTWGLQQCIPNNRDSNITQEKLCQPREVQVYVKLVKHATTVLDIYLITSTGRPGALTYTKLSPSAISPQLKNKEEKEVLEHFAGIFNIMNPETFRQIFVQCIDTLIERFIGNPLLQVVINSFLANQLQSSTFATILLTYLLARLPVLGSTDPVRPPIYLKLFRSIFGSISLYPLINEAVLEPHLVSLVSRCVTLSKSAAYPSNYLMLLRCLFRAIGGGTTERLYKEFYQLLPSLLKTLSRLNYDCHRSEIHDLFVELCLTVPVRLSTLLPFLHLLMGPLVSALSGSASLVQQGLRTLELCVDNVQPDYFYNYIQPVHRDLMSALCCCLNGPPDVAQTAMRIFGKLGGTGRDRITENHILTPSTTFNIVTAITLRLEFSSRGSVDLKLDDAVQVAAKILYQNACHEQQSSALVSDGIAPASAKEARSCFLSKQAFDFVHAILFHALTGGSGSLLAVNDMKNSLCATSNSGAIRWQRNKPFTLADLEKLILPEERGRLFIRSLVESVLLATLIPELHKVATEMSVFAVDRLCFFMIAQEAGIFPDAVTATAGSVTVDIVSAANTTALSVAKPTVDGWILFDAVLSLLASERKDVVNLAIQAIDHMFRNFVLLLDNDFSQFWSLVSLQYFVEKVLRMCYLRPWFSKAAGCRALLNIMQLASSSPSHVTSSNAFLVKNVGNFADAFFYVLSDIDQEVSFCCLDLAGEAVNKLFDLILSSQGTFPAEVIGSIIGCKLVPNIFSSSEHVRTYTTNLLSTVSTKFGNYKSVGNLLKDYDEQIKACSINCRDKQLKLLPYATQVGLLNGCLYLTRHLPGPVYFVAESATTTTEANCQSFNNLLIALCDDNERDILSQPSYKNVTSIASLKCVALQLLATPYNVTNITLAERIFGVVCKTILDVSCAVDVAKVAFESAKNLLSADATEKSTLSLTKIFDQVVKPFLTQQLADPAVLTIEIVRRVHYLIQLFPGLVSEQALDELLLSHLDFWLERATPTHKNPQNIAGHLYSAELRLAVVVLETFQYFPGDILSTSLLARLISTIAAKESAMLMQNSSPLSEPLLSCLRCHPAASVTLMFSDRFVSDTHTAEMFLQMLKNESKATELRQELLAHRELLYGMLNFQRSPALTFVSLRCFCILLRYAPSELASDDRLAELLLVMWTDVDFVSRFTNVYWTENNFSYWRIPYFVAKLLVHRAISLEHSNESVDLAFHLLSSFDGRFVYQFQNVRKFIDEIVVKTYPVSWVRAAFFRFAAIFASEEYSQDFKARVIVNIIIPAFSNAFEAGHTDSLIGSKPQPDLDSDDNIISVFLNTIIDPDSLRNLSDNMMVALLQLACLLVDCAPSHIHDSVSKKQGTKLRRLMTFAWPSLLPRNCIDPSVKYYGHLLLAHIIAKFAIHKKIVLQVLNSLLKAHTSDANVKAIVHSALHTLMPALPSRIASDDATTLLGHLTKRILLDDGQQPIACAHVLALVIRHQKLYYPVRFQILELCCQGMTRILNQSSTLTADNKKLIIDLCEVIIRWEQQRLSEDAAAQPMVTVTSSEAAPVIGSAAVVGQQSQPYQSSSSTTAYEESRKSIDSSTIPGSSGLTEIRRSRHISGASSSVTKRPMERSQCDTIVNCLIRVASFVDSSSASSSAASSAASSTATAASAAATSTSSISTTAATTVTQLDASGKRALCLLKSVICPEMWPSPEIQLQWMDRILLQSENASSTQQQQQQAGGASQAMPQQQSSQANSLAMVCSSLESLTFLVSILSNKEHILNCLKQIQIGLVVCVRCTNLRVAKLVHLILSRVMSFWPPYDLPSPPSMTGATIGQQQSQYAPRDELEPLYAACAKVIHEGLVKLEKVQPLTLLQLTPTMLLVRTARVHSHSYVDKILSGLVHVLQRLTKDHTQSDTPGQGASDLILIGLELLKGRTAAMTVDTQKEFIVGILGVLIEKSSDPKVIKMIIRIVEEWMIVRNPSSSAATLTGPSASSATAVPSPRERTALLCKLMNNVERRFSNDEDICTSFYSVVLQVYRDESCRGIEIASKLEPAFLCGLKSRNPELRAKFFDVLDSNLQRLLIDRLLYITSSQNWENIGQHFWIKQCVELVLAVAEKTPSLSSNIAVPVLPSFSPPSPPPAICIGGTNGAASSSVAANVPVQASQVTTSCPVSAASTTAPPPIPSLAVKIEPLPQAASLTLMEVDIAETKSELASGGTECSPSNTGFPKSCSSLANFFSIQQSYQTENSGRNVDAVVTAICHLVHSDVSLASAVWIDLFIKVWRILSRKQQQVLSTELVPFLCSGAHLIQRDLQPSALKPIFEACLLAGPTPICLRPFCVKYVGKTHRAWYEAVLALERYFFSQESVGEHSAAGTASTTGSKRSKQMDGTVRGSSSSPVIAGDSALASAISFSGQEVTSCLSELYDHLGEVDMRCALWQRKTTIPEASNALNLFQHGLYDPARGAFEQTMRRAVEKHSQSPMNAHEVTECQLWEDCWVDCCKQLSLWQVLKEANSNAAESEANSLLLADVLWRLPDWSSMKDQLSRIDINSCPTEWQWKMSLYQGYTCLSLTGSQAMPNVDDIVAAASSAASGSASTAAPTYATPSIVQRCVEAAFQFLMRDWRRLPAAITPAHSQILQAAQQVIELNEAPLIVQAFSHGPGTREQQHTVKTILKTWKNRLPLITESLEHWSNIISWRQHNYRLISNEFSNQPPTGSSSASQQAQTIVQDVSMYVGVHESCHTLIQFGRIARKQGVYSVCWEVLDRIYTIPTIPVVDVFRRIRQQLKCYMQLGLASGNKHDFQEGLDILDACKMQYFNKEMTAPLLAQRGSFLTHVGKVDEAQKSFSAAFQLDDPPSMAGAWGQWGELLEQLFMRDRSQLFLAVNALCCFTHACRTLKPGKGRKFLARVFWLLTFDDQRVTNCLTETFSKRYAMLIPPAQFAHWMPQFVTCLLRQPSGKFLTKTAMVVAQVLPQQLYYILRAAYLSLKPSTNNALENILLDVVNGASLPQVQSASAATSRVDVKAEPEESQSTTVSTFPLDMEVEAKYDHKNADVKTEVGQQATALATASEPLARLCLVLRSVFEAHPTFVSAAELLLSNIHSIQQPPKPSILAVKLSNLVTDSYRRLYVNKGQDISPVPEVLVQEVSALVNLAQEQLATIRPDLRDAFVRDFQPPNSDQIPAVHQVSTIALAQLLTKWQKVLDEQINLKDVDSSTLESTFCGIDEKKKLLPSSLIYNCDLLSELEIPGEAAPGALVTTDSSEGGIASAAVPPTGSSALAGGLGIGGPFSRDRSHLHIVKILPHSDVVFRFGQLLRRVHLLAANGKVFSYMLKPTDNLAKARCEDSVLQLSRTLNPQLLRCRETARRGVRFSAVRTLCTSPTWRFIEDSPKWYSLGDVWRLSCKQRAVDADQPFNKFFERLFALQNKNAGGQATLSAMREIFKEVQSIVPRSFIRDWAATVFPDQTQYFLFRKRFITNLSVASMAEYIFYFTPMTPEMLLIDIQTGVISVCFHQFDLDEATANLDANRSVPFRLTPALADFMTSLGVAGPFVASCSALTRSLAQPPASRVSGPLRLLLKDVFLAMFAQPSFGTNAQKVPFQASGAGSNNNSGDSSTENSSGLCDEATELVINSTNKAAANIVTRLLSLVSSSNVENLVPEPSGASASSSSMHSVAGLTSASTTSNIQKLVNAAQAADNLCRVDPTLLPWL